MHSNATCYRCGCLNNLTMLRIATELLIFSQFGITLGAWRFPINSLLANCYTIFILVLRL